MATKKVKANVVTIALPEGKLVGELTYEEWMTSATGALGAMPVPPPRERTKGVKSADPTRDAVMDPLIAYWEKKAIYPGHAQFPANGKPLSQGMIGKFGGVEPSSAWCWIKKWQRPLPDSINGGSVETTRPDGTTVTESWPGLQVLLDLMRANDAEWQAAHPTKPVEEATKPKGKPAKKKAQPKKAPLKLPPTKKAAEVNGPTVH